jgi:oxygen-independent coproporphyrinogen III oxidase
MAGIYLHIPYCKEACTYCDFHFSIQLKDKSIMVGALMEEIKQRKHLLDDATIETIYFGGGTPSLLKITELQKILELIHKEFTISANPEITIEANPDDLIRSYTSALSDVGINRLSIGVQSWSDEDLVKLNRRHSSNQAEKAINNVIEDGISNVSIDLIYGLPDMNIEKWKYNLLKTFSFNITHISAYHLTYEEGTVLDYLRKKKKIKPVEEEESEEEFMTLLQDTEDHGFKQYELSNFSKNGFESRHNSSYWNRLSYLGIGPSAHSFIGKTRSWNISNNKKYIEGILAGNYVSENEQLSTTDEFNEYLMTGFRMRKGLDLDYLLENFGKDKLKYFEQGIISYIKEGLAEDHEGRIRLTAKGMFLSDRIISDMMIV